MADIVYEIDIGVEAFSVLLCTVLIYCSAKVHPFKKPPGSLIMVEMILICLIQLIWLVGDVVWNLSDTKSSGIRLLPELIDYFIWTYCFYTIPCYEICVAIEVYLRLRVEKIKQPFRKRAIIYHAASHSIGFCYGGIILAGFEFYGDGEDYCEYDYNLWIFWFILSYLIVHLTALVILASIISYRNSRLSDSDGKRFTDKLIKYIIVVVIVRVIRIPWLISFSILDRNLDNNEDKLLAYSCLEIFFDILTMIPYIFRMFDPNIKEFLKHKVKSMKYRIKDKMNYMMGNRALNSSMLINQTLIPVRKFFDAILIENIEFQLISLSIAMLKSSDNYDEV